MKKIFKYPLDVQFANVVPMPKGAEILSVAEQRNQIVVYAMVDDEVSEMEDQVIHIEPTGHPVEIDVSKCRFLGTVKMYEGDYMFHVFVEVK